MDKYDLVFIGNITFYEIEAEEGFTPGLFGGPPLFAAFAASCKQKRIAVVTRMAKEDENHLTSLKVAGIDVYLQHSDQTTNMRVVHPTSNLDERLLYQTKNAGYFSLEDLPSFEPCLVHLGALTDQEFTIEFMHGLKERGFRLSVDMQNFVRQVDIETSIVHFRDVPEKRDIACLANIVKLDVVEAEILTGTRDLEQAALNIEKWGCQEVIVTRSDGVLARCMGKTYFKRFSNMKSNGRTGRGDTTIGSYLVHRLDHNPEDSLRFAAALASIKLETSVPFNGTLQDVLKRMSP